MRVEIIIYWINAIRSSINDVHLCNVKRANSLLHCDRWSYHFIVEFARMRWIDRILCVAHQQLIILPLSITHNTQRITISIMNSVDASAPSFSAEFMRIGRMKFVDVRLRPIQRTQPINDRKYFCSCAAHVESDRKREETADNRNIGGSWSSSNFPFCAFDSITTILQY